MIDFRYHAMSLAAVFVALALGLLLGVTLGDTNIIANVRGGLEDSLKKDVNEARTLASERKQQIEQQDEFITATYPQLVRGDLAGRRLATVGSATVAQDTLRSVGRAVDPAGADVSWVAQLLAKPQYTKIAAALKLSRFTKGPLSAEEADQLGRAVGRRLARGRDVAVMRRLVFSRFSGRFGRVRLFVYARQQPAGAKSKEGEVFDGFERGVVAGLTQQSERVVGIENTTTMPSNIKWYRSLGLSTVDNIEAWSGRYALVTILRGAKGDYGVKDSAGSLVPEIGP